MPTVPSRSIAVVGGLALALILKVGFDYLVWDHSFNWLYLMVRLKADPITAILSYVIPLASGAAAYAALSPHPPHSDRPALRKHPWQSRRLIVGVLLVIVATVAGLSYGRVFGLPSITLPQSR